MLVSVQSVLSVLLSIGWIAETVWTGRGTG